MKTLVCIGFAEALSAPEVAWSLVDAGFQVVTFARKGRRTALHHSRYVVPIEITPPEADWQAALVDLERLLVAWSADGAERVLLPLDDAAVWLCSQLKHPGDWVLAGPRGWASELALDKWIQLESARSAGLNVPETTLARKADDVLAKGHTLPLTLRPAHAVFNARKNKDAIGGGLGTGLSMLKLAGFRESAVVIRNHKDTKSPTGEHRGQGG